MKKKMGKEEKSLSKAVEDELLKPLLDIIVNYAEIGLDNFIDNEIVSEAPIVKTLFVFAKPGVIVKDFSFLQRFQSLHP
ncbi:hypothetical protein [uncultured Marixanthomonas sp.]|uniref:hypothetical protein n=1 Tax=uncultured Marixanthomonas sp. TaxID=757245 RepID=UPI0030D8A198|tara:strand:+ start:16660 stop:16896 length:237 start_codon:yes stop_codon:yes gene_type:complete